MRELHIGRLIDHIHLRARDLAATKRFYRAVLGALDKPIGADDETHLSCDELWIDALGNERQSATHVHLAFQARDTMPCGASTKPGSPPAGGTTAPPASGSITPGTSPPSCSTPTATMSKPCTTGRRSARPNRW